jgi:hypothetical protein
VQLTRKRFTLQATVAIMAISGCVSTAWGTNDGPNVETVAPDSAPDSVMAENVTVRFKEAGADQAPDFQRHVAPLLGRLGCNGRACHGSFQGQGGFRLSLFGYDFNADHAALLQADAGRVDVAAPENSLILTKPTDEDNHEGGLRYEVDSWQYNLLKTWIEDGAKTSEQVQRLEQLVVEPAELRLSDPTEKIKLRAIAHWDDGTVEDVTPLCRFRSNDDSIASITEEGSVSTDEVPGDTHVVVFYDRAVVPVPVIHPIKKGSTASTLQTPTMIDQLTAQKWEKLGLEPSELSDDAMFLRRVSIDITGTLPTPEEIREFLSDTNPDKRRIKIDELLESPAYVAWWTTFFCDMTENNTVQLRNISYDNNAASQQWYDWIHRRVEENVPYDKMIAGIVTGVSRQPDESYTEYCARMSQMTKPGGSYADCESMPYYWMRREFQDRDTRAISFAHAFLGLRIQCAQCHKHPFDQWSQDDFKQFSKFFAGVSAQNYNGGRNPEDRKAYAEILKKLDIDPKGKNNGEIRKKLAVAMRQGEVTPFGFLELHEPRPSREEQRELQEKIKEARKQNKKIQYKKPEITEATLLGGEPVDLTKFDDTRQPVMEWMRRTDNPFFAKALVNRVWSRYFGAGIVDPADDLNLANPPSNAALLDYLAAEFINQGFDLKWLHREIANSRTYQLSWIPNETNVNDRKNFSRALPRRLPAEVLFDAVASAASNSKTNRDFRESIDDRAISIPGTMANNYGKKKSGTDSAFALKVFGRSERASSCDCDRSDETSLIQTVYMQNDRDIHTMLTQKNSWINQMAIRHQATNVSDSDKRQMQVFNQRIAGLEKAIVAQKKNRNDRQVQKIENQIESMKQKIRPIEDRIAASEITKEKMDTREVVTEAYLRTLSRFPSEEEIARCETHIREDKDLINGVTGVLWALVNTKEFIVNH